MSDDTAGVANSVAAGQLRSFVERIERVEQDIKDLNTDKSEIYKELRGVGFDVRAVRKCVAQRKLDDADRAERDEIFDLYWNALTGGLSRVHVHETVERVTHQPGQPDESTSIEPSPAIEQAGAPVVEGPKSATGVDGAEAEHGEAESLAEHGVDGVGSTGAINAEGRAA